MDKTLKSCPFCGGSDISLNKCSMRTRCKECGAGGPMLSRFMDGGRSEVEAATLAWNTRAAEVQEVRHESLA